MTITLTPTTEARLREKAVLEGRDMDSIADALLQTVLDWEERERSETVAGIRLGLAASDAGRVRPIADFAEAMRAKYDLPAHLTDAELGAEVILP